MPLQKTETTEKSADKDNSTAQLSEFVPVKGLSKKYGDLENRSFAYDGKTFTLEKNTMEDLIDVGIPYDEKELNNKENNVNSNYESGRYTVSINDYVSMQFVFMNNTYSNLTCICGKMSINLSLLIKQISIKMSTFHGFRNKFNVLALIFKVKKMEIPPAKESPFFYRTCINLNDL